MANQRRREEVDSGAGGQRGGMDSLSQEDCLLHGRQAGAAPFDRPVQPEVARCTQPGLPAATDGEELIRVVARVSQFVGPGTVKILFEPGEKPGSEGLLFCSESEVHWSLA